MSYNNHFTGAITITPPLRWAEIQGGPSVSDVRLRTPQSVVDTDAGQVVTIIGDAIVPLEMGSYNGYSVTDDVQAIVDHYGPLGHEFAGHIQVQWDPGFGESTPARYVVREGRVETVTPRLAWPGKDDALLADARALALLCRDVLKELPHDLAGILDVEWEELPDWFTGDAQGRELWSGGA